MAGGLIEFVYKGFLLTIYLTKSILVFFSLKVKPKVV